MIISFIAVYDRKESRKVRITDVDTFFRVRVKRTYSRDVSVDQGRASYLSIMTRIAGFFTVNLGTKTKGGKVCYVSRAIVRNSTSKDKVRKYFYHFPLHSSKRLAYMD